MGSVADPLNPGIEGKEKPLIVLCVWPVPGHTYGLIQAAEFLVKRGFQCFFCGGLDLEAQIRNTGAEFFPHERLITDKQKRIFSVPAGFPRSNFVLKHIFIDSTEMQHRALMGCLETARQRYPERQVIILHESYAMGLLPLYCGVPLPKGYDKMPRVINFHPTVNVCSSVDTAPFSPGLPPATTHEDRERYRALYDEIRPGARAVVEYANEVYKRLGATEEMDADFFSDVLMTAHNVTLMTCSPSLEYPRSDLSPKIKFIGGMPLKPLSSKLVYPSWWSAVTANAALPDNSAAKKRVVTVTQGTLHLNYDQLIIPTLLGLAGRQDLIVVALLGVHGARLQLPSDSNTATDGGAALPANAYVLDYFPYDAILPFSDVFISNAGYGGFMHGVMNGTPMVMAGVSADKAEVSMRVEWAGLGVNLGTQSPTPEMVRRGVDTVLGDGKFKARALQLKRENEALDALGAIERQIWEYAE